MELIIVAAIISSLAVLGTMNLVGSQRQSGMDAAVVQVVSDLREQRIRAMTGDTEGTGTISSYGIYFGTDAYTLFRGNSYAAGDAANFVVNLDSTISFANVNFPGGVVVFSDGSGEVAGWSSATDSFALTDPDNGTTKTITINQYGVPVAIN